MKATLRLILASATVAFITLAASGAPLPFLPILTGPPTSPAATLEAPLAPDAGLSADQPLSTAFTLN